MKRALIAWAAKRWAGISLGLAAGSVVVALGAGSFALGVKYEAGREALAREAAVEQALKDAKDTWAADLEDLEARHRHELRVALARQERRDEIANVATPECVDLGAEWLRLHNEAVRGALPAVTN